MNHQRRRKNKELWMDISSKLEDARKSQAGRWTAVFLTVILLFLMALVIHQSHVENPILSESQIPFQNSPSRLSSKGIEVNNVFRLKVAYNSPEASQPIQNILPSQKHIIQVVRFPILKLSEFPKTPLSILNIQAIPNKKRTKREKNIQLNIGFSALRSITGHWDPMQNIAFPDFNTKVSYLSQMHLITQWELPLKSAGWFGIIQSRLGFMTRQSFMENKQITSFSPNHLSPESFYWSRKHISVGMGIGGAKETGKNGWTFRHQLQLGSAANWLIHQNFSGSKRVSPQEIIPSFYMAGYLSLQSQWKIHLKPQNTKILIGPILEISRGVNQKNQLFAGLQTNVQF